MIDKTTDISADDNLKLREEVSRGLKAKVVNKLILNIHNHMKQGINCIISALYGHVGEDKVELAEISRPPWNFRVAKYITRFRGIPTISIRPTLYNKLKITIIDNVLVILVPYSIAKRPIHNLLKVISQESLLENPKFMYDIITRIVDNYKCIQYIHEYKNVKYLPLYLRCPTCPFILQHHSRMPFRISLTRPHEAAKLRIILSLKNSVFFTLSKYEQETLQSLGLGDRAFLRPMAVDFNEIPLVTREEKLRLREKLGLPTDAVILATYVATPIYRRGTLYEVKGAHWLPYIIRYLKDKYHNIEILVFNVNGTFKEFLEKIGAKTFTYIPHKRYLEYIYASDLYFLPATSGLKYLGIQVAVMEAMAAGKPIVSPTLIHYPETKAVKQIGAVTKFVDSINDLKDFINKLETVLENIDRYNSREIRELAYKYYSWESFINDFEKAVEILTV